MYQTPPGFIPPPVPLVPVAANGIVATGGLLAGAAAGAAAGAKAGAVFGPKGIVAAALIGGVVLPLLLPLTTAPNSLPGIDPGLNDPNPGGELEIGAPEGVTPVPTPPGPAGQIHNFKIRFELWKYDRKVLRCSDGAHQSGTGKWVMIQGLREVGINAAEFSIVTGRAGILDVCSGEGILTGPPHRKTVLGGQATSGDGTPLTYEWHWDNFFTQGTGGVSYAESRHESRVEIVEVLVDDEPVPDLFPPSTVKPKPRPTPVPLEPLPAPDPEPALVPFPEPDPRPDPVERPCKDDPHGPPISIPKAPPAPPKKVPGPGEVPGRTPILPTPIAPPLPVPGVPTIPEPSPDPRIRPAPGPFPSPLPFPGPNPNPGPCPSPSPAPGPGTFPLPIPPGTPGPGPITKPGKPENPQDIDPGTGLVPRPAPSPKPTPPEAHFPVPKEPPVTGGGTRPVLKAIAQEVGRIEQKVARIQRGEGSPDLSDWLWLLPLLQQFFEQPIPGTTYDLQGVCESVEQGQDQPVAEFPVEAGKNLQAIINRIDALPDVLQQHLAYRTPICRGTAQEGDFRTISFISDQLSPGGKRRLDRRFRYRSQSGVGLIGVVDHWKSFVWEAGPVLVKHRDAWWGSPRVWASTVDEGKRVIRHAAGEAGLDPDQVGRWEVSGSNNPRVGAPGTMRVNTSGGYYMITARDGSSERPLVVTTLPDP